MVAGIVLFAFALKGVLAHVGDDLDTVQATALYGGPALYLLAHDAMRCNPRTYNPRRFAAWQCGLLALLPVSPCAGRRRRARRQSAGRSSAGEALRYSRREPAFATPEIWCALSPR